MLIIPMMFMAAIFIQMKHPLSMSLILLMQTVMVSIQTGIMSFNTWFSYIMFLIMIGGMLVLFIYMTSVASNEKFNFKSNDLILPSTSIIILLTMPIFQEQMSNTTNMWSIVKNMQLIKYLNFPSNMIILMMMIYLLITLIAVVTISNINHGPLRQKF
uniref:NADH-ubiquinone oxidoreductase chain 6 n=1 Tax=Histeridae sp. BMNH 1274743 TaxID=1796510 RepID=A0A140EG60_9COLE|nr:NADH dehydrogenase subunit 6 [Histeridae sp. BMNH 1274743]